MDESTKFLVHLLQNRRMPSTLKQQDERDGGKIKFGDLGQKEEQ